MNKYRVFVEVRYLEDDSTPYMRLQTTEFSEIVKAPTAADAIVAFNKAMITKYGKEHFKKFFCGGPHLRTWTAVDLIGEA